MTNKQETIESSLQIPGREICQFKNHHKDMYVYDPRHLLRHRRMHVQEKNWNFIDFIECHLMFF